MRIWILGFVSAVVVIFTGCASTKQSVQKSPIDQIAPEGVSKIVVSRPHKLFGSGIAFTITDGTNSIGKIGPGGMLAWIRPAGLVELKGEFDVMGNRKTIFKQFYIDAGKSQFVQINILASGLDNRLEFRLLGERDTAHVISTH